MSRFQYQPQKLLCVQRSTQMWSTARKKKMGKRKRPQMADIVELTNNTKVAQGLERKAQKSWRQQWKI